MTLTLTYPPRKAPNGFDGDRAAAASALAVLVEDAEKNLAGGVTRGARCLAGRAGEALVALLSSEMGSLEAILCDDRMYAD